MPCQRCVKSAWRRKRIWRICRNAIPAIPVSYTHLSLRSFYRYLNEYVGITQNPFLYFKTPKRAKRIPEFLFYDEMDTFLSSFDLDTPDGLRDRAMFELMYACGLRVSEAASLRLYDIDLHDRILTIHGKGNKQRIVPFYALAGELLEHYLQEVDVYKRQVHWISIRLQ